jgi:hypothetical protein
VALTLLIFSEIGSFDGDPLLARDPRPAAEQQYNAEALQIFGTRIHWADPVGRWFGLGARLLAG